MESSLYELAENQIAYIKEIRLEGANRRTLMDMGLIPGVPVCVKRRAPFNGAIQLQFNCSQLVIRHTDAKHIFVTDRL